MSRQPIQVAVYCFRHTGTGHQYLVLHRNPGEFAIWQGVTGGVEGDESLESAARREVLEETGYQIADLARIGYSYSYPCPDSMQCLYDQPVETLTDEVFLGRVESDCDPQLDTEEHDDWLWCSYDEALDLLYWPANKESLQRCEEVLNSSKEF